MRLAEFALQHNGVLEAIAAGPGRGVGERAVQALPRVAADADAVLVDADRVGERLEALLALLDQLSPPVTGGFPVCLLHGGGEEAGEAVETFVGIASRELGTRAVAGYERVRVVCERPLLEPVLEWAQTPGAGRGAREDGGSAREAELQRQLVAREGEIKLLEGLLGQREHYLATLEMAVTEQADQLHATWSSAYWRLTAPLRALVEGYRATRARLRSRRAGPETVSIPLASLEWEEVQAGDTRARPARWRRAPEIGMRAPWRLEQHVPSRVVYRLECAPGTTASADVAVHSHAWSPAQSPVRAHLAVLDAAGEAVHRASAELDPRQRDGGSRRAHLSVPLAPGGECRVALEAEALDPAATRAAIAWERARIDVAAPAGADPVAPDGGPRRARRGPEPVVSVVLPVHDPPPEFLRRAVDSVRAQTYGRWQLCLADDGSRDPEIVELLRRYAAGDPRIELTRNERGGGISAGSNTALALATGEYVALLDHDDELEPDALELVVERLREDPGLDVVYTDEDRILADGSRFGAMLKPDWSPELLRSGMYTCHLGVYRRRLVEEVGGFRSGFDGSQDFDLMLRLVERTDRIAHVPRVLYHWRASDTSVALNPMAKPYAYQAGTRALQEHLDRTGMRGRAYRTHLPGLYGIRHEPDPSATVSIVVPAGEADDERLRSAIDARTAHASWDLVCVTPEPGEPLGATLNRGAGQATGEHVLLLAAPALPLDEGWLTALLGIGAQEGVAAVGAKVLAPDGTIADGGIVIGEGVPLPVYRGVRADYMGYLGTLEVPSNYSAVAGALLARRERLLELGALGPYASPLAEADFCLRASVAGLRCALAPGARLELTEPAGARATSLVELATFKRTWGRRLARDPYYHPTFWQQRVAFPAPARKGESVTPLVAAAQAEDGEQERREEDLDAHDDQSRRPHGEALL